MLTRSDFYYLCDHPPPHSLVALGSKQVAVPYEEVFKADPVYCSDRHAVVSRDGLGAYLGVLETALKQGRATRLGEGRWDHKAISTTALGAAQKDVARSRSAESLS